MANLRHEVYIHDGTSWNLINPLLTLSDFGINVAANEINLLSGATSNIQDQLDTLNNSTFLPLAGGTMDNFAQIKMYSTACSNIQGRDYAAIIQTRSLTSAAFAPFLSTKTSSGSWTIGTANNENLQFIYGSDTNYNNEIDATNRWVLNPTYLSLNALNGSNVSKLAAEMYASVSGDNVGSGFTSYYNGTAKAKLYSSGEGGNLRLVAPDGNYIEQDLYNSTHWRMYSATADGTFGKAISWHFKQNRILDTTLDFRGQITGDMDDYFVPGYYYIGGTTPTHAPTDTMTWQIVLILNTTTDYSYTTGYATQLVFANGRVFHRQHAGNPQAWGTWLSRADNVTGTVAIGNGGTGATTAADALTNLGAAAANHTHSTYVAKAGDTMSGKLWLTLGSSVHTANAGGGTAGYLKVATFKISGGYVSAPIELKFMRRGDALATVLSIRWTNVSGTDPAISTFTYQGPVSACYIQKSATSTWDLYIQKSENYDSIGIVEFYRPGYMDSGVSVTWQNTLVSSVPSGYTQASAWALPVAQGGTGATTAATALTNLGAAAASHNHSAANITSGTLGVARGGTGATTFTSGAALIGNGTSAIGTRAIYTRSTAGTCDWGSNNNALMDKAAIAYWNGAYTGTSSNLKYAASGFAIGGNTAWHAGNALNSKTTNTGSTNIGAQTEGQVSTTSCAAGTWLIIYSCWFASNITGTLSGYIQNGSSKFIARNDAAYGADLCVSCITTTSSTVNITFHAGHNRTAQTTVYWWWHKIRLY